MGLFGRTKKPTLTRKESLDAVVVANENVGLTRSEEGSVTLHLPYRPPPVLARLTRLLGGSGEGGVSDVELDEIGSFCWDLFDGRTTVRDMIGRLAERYKINRKEAEVALTAFIRTLARKRLVIIAIRKPPDEDG
jgi:hypothetical protein